MTAGAKRCTRLCVCVFISVLIANRISYMPKWRYKFMSHRQMYLLAKSIIYVHIHVYKCIYNYFHSYTYICVDSIIWDTCSCSINTIPPISFTIFIAYFSAQTCFGLTKNVQCTTKHAVDTNWRFRFYYFLLLLWLIVAGGREQVAEFI